jgi:hypothetical protein
LAAKGIRTGAVRNIGYDMLLEEEGIRRLDFVAKQKLTPEEERLLNDLDVVIEKYDRGKRLSNHDLSIVMGFMKFHEKYRKHIEAAVENDPKEAKAYVYFLGKIQEIVKKGGEDIDKYGFGPRKAMAARMSFVIPRKPGFYLVDPDDFLKLAPLELGPRRSDEYMAKLKEDITKNGVTMPAILEFNAAGEVTSEEGRHRALIAKELGQKLPVIVDYPDDEWYDKYFEKYPEDEFLKRASLGRFLKEGRVGSAFAYADHEHYAKLIKLFNVPEKFKQLGVYM